MPEMPKPAPASEPPLEPGAVLDELASSPGSVDPDDDDPEPALDPAVEPEDVPGVGVVPEVLGIGVVLDEADGPVPVGEAPVPVPVELAGAGGLLPLEQAIGPRSVNTGIHERRCCPVAIVGSSPCRARGGASPTEFAFITLWVETLGVIQRFVRFRSFYERTVVRRPH
jgi:hypothetical protein